MNPMIVTAAAALLILLGLVIIPIINRKQFNKLPTEQKVRVLMKQANSLSYFKNVASGRRGTLYYVKNKRKIYVMPWVLTEGKMLCERQSLFEQWDYPEEQPFFTDEEREHLLDELRNYNNRNKIKLYFHDEADE